MDRREALPPIDTKVKDVRLKNAIEQQFAGSGGIFRQTNIEKRRVYNLPQWREVCESTDHQPPAKRGEVRTAGHTVGKRKIKAKPKNPARKKVKRITIKIPALARSSWISWQIYQSSTEELSSFEGRRCIICNQTPDLPGWFNKKTSDILCDDCGINLKTGISHRTSNDQPTEQITQIPSPEQSSDEQPIPSADNKESTFAESLLATGQPINNDCPTIPVPPQTLKRKRSVSLSAIAGEPDEDFENFDYRVSNSSEYTVERCKELERIYWKTLTFNNPMYGADMPGSLFDDRTEIWNVAKLDNLLCRIGKLIPGVNSAYLYLGMWKATFSWHVEVLVLFDCF